MESLPQCSKCHHLVASEQNGKFKIEWTKVKEWIMGYKRPVVENALTDATSSNFSAGNVSLNIHQGLAETVLDRMIAEQARSQEKKQQMRERGKAI